MYHAEYVFSTIRKVTIHTTGGQYEMYGKLSDLPARLPESDFIFIHKSYLGTGFTSRQFQGTASHCTTAQNFQ